MKFVFLKCEVGDVKMCTMIVSGSVCSSKPMKVVRDKTLDGLAAYVRERCATPQSSKRYLASVGLSRRRGKIHVKPL